MHAKGILLCVCRLQPAHQPTPPGRRLHHHGKYIFCLLFKPVVHPLQSIVPAPGKPRPRKRQHILCTELRHVELLRQGIAAAKVDEAAAPGIDIKARQMLFPAHKTGNQQDKVPPAGKIKHAARVILRDRQQHAFNGRGVCCIHIIKPRFHTQAAALEQAAHCTLFS